MPEIEINQEAEGQPSGETVLGEAAVTSAVLSGAAAAKADEANTRAHDAEHDAETARAVAASAMESAGERPTRDEVAAMVNERVSQVESTILSRLDELAASSTPPSGDPPSSEPPKDKAPASVATKEQKESEDGAKKKSWYDRYLGAS